MTERFRVQLQSVKDQQRREYRTVVLQLHSRLSTVDALLAPDMALVLEKEIPPLYFAIRNDFILSEAVCVEYGFFARFEHRCRLRATSPSSEMGALP